MNSPQANLNQQVKASKSELRVKMKEGWKRINFRVSSHFSAPWQFCPGRLFI